MENLLLLMREMLLVHDPSVVFLSAELFEYKSPHDGW